ncbi:fructuronate reductase [Pectobacterium brasiliense]|uniref:fructuronate reductase n=1 Tax=Pectobacterium brasiliense TaxID=180957 RepID=UPI001CE2323F|nr:fructuronate reductase [Pectobacterium brasiliense]EKU2182040.1 fructuronate reductase [Citrobacter freundii]EKV4363654.1 fructuronate reductase [Citrobacter freundii]MCA5921922.1 fructuronate reductase [Pectobacterium brasiliense]MCA5929269.1 fructuronate reductase [Pectobacterium brasiliense]MCA5937914.1 fructuronate reductase [Pectobacterium brasiliense]
MKNKVYDLDICPKWDRSRLKSRIVHLGFGAFHRAHQALFTHDLLNISDSDWGLCEVSLMPGNDVTLIKNLKDQNYLYTVAEKNSEKTEIKIVGSIKEALHPLIDGIDEIIEAMVRKDTAIISLTITEKGYCTDPSTGKLDFNNALIKEDLGNPNQPKSAIGYIVAALKMRFEKGTGPVTILSCDNVRENGHAAKSAVLGFAEAIDGTLKSWIEENVTFPCTMVDRIVPAATSEALDEIAEQLGVYDPCAIACEPFRQWVIEDNFVSGRPDWDKVGAQFVKDVIPFELMKLRMLNGSHSFLAYLGCLGGYETIADTMSNPMYKKCARELMLKEQAITLDMPEETDLQAYADLLIERFSNTALRHKTWQIAMDGSQKLPQRLLDPVRTHLLNKSSFKLTALGIAAWLRYVKGADEKNSKIDVIDPLSSEIKLISSNALNDDDRVNQLLGINSIFGDDLPNNKYFLDTVKFAYKTLDELGARGAIVYFGETAN